ncbi:hypothetical protein ACROYT_G027128 [Oculina patagonica]
MTPELRGADAYSDHYRVRTRIRLKLARTEGKKIARERFDVCKLQIEEIRRRYNIEMRNRFEALGDIEEPEEEHDLILATYRDAAKKVIGRSDKQSKPWIGDKTWEKIKERKEAKNETGGWVEHFSEILNRDDPVNPVEEDEIEEPEEIGEIDLGSWRLPEVKDALKGTKPGKAPGVDEVGPELLRADMEDTVHRLTTCYNRLWETERWPEM